MNPNHHPGTPLLLSYASGSLTEGLALVVASHLNFCSQCRNDVRDAEMLGASLLENLEPYSMNSNSLNLILDKIDDTIQEKIVYNYKSHDSEIPEPLWNYLNSPLDNLSWKFLAPGIRQVTIPADTGINGTARLFKITPGTTLPIHTHSGMELSLVLRGSYSDELGRFQPGDVADVDQDDKHQPIADTDQDCICLIATEGPTVYEGILNKMLQPIFKI
jgi:putative transcriptional regulator